MVALQQKKTARPVRGRMAREEERAAYLFLLPWLIGLLVFLIGPIVASLLNPELGAVNQFLRWIGIENPPRWLNSPTWAVPSLVLVGVWGIGGGAIIYLAGLQNIPPHLYEAAEMDGAGAWAKFWNVTIPLLTPTLFFSLITSLIGAFQIFDTAFIMGGSRGGDQRCAQLLPAESVE